MKKLKKQDLINVLILIIFVNLFYFTITKNGFLYGSTTDWKDQHYLFAEYFRNLFYKTGNLIPEFAPNIGGGQNIFNFAYYGLLNPIILISYLFPKISMMDYVIFSSVFIVIISVLLFYKFLKTNNLPSHICFITSFLFMCASPILFHSHRHIMFINYMPFLIIGLIGTDKFLKEDKIFLIIISTFLMIITSYYYSVCSLFVMFIYFTYKYLVYNEKFEYKKYFIKLIKYLYFLFLGVLLSCFYLLPTFNSIMSGRVTTKRSLNLLELFVPNFNIGYVLYDCYGMGLTCISICSLLYFLTSKDKNNKILSIALLIIFFIPIFLFILNGTLYINSKALIPFIPILCYLTGLFIKNIEEKNVNFKYIFIILIIILIIAFILKFYNFKILLIDTIITVLFYLLCSKNKKISYILLILISIYNLKISNDTEVLYSIDKYSKDFRKSVEKEINKIQENDKSFYRINNNLSKLSTVNKIYNLDYYQSSLYSSTYNGYYNNFYNNIFSNEISYRNSIITSESNNLLFQIFMGEKYIITKNPKKIGYELIEEKDDYNVYENTNALPIGFASNKTLSYEIFKTLEYPYNVEALLNYIIVDDDSKNNYETNIEKYDITNIDIPFEYQKNNDKYYLSFDKTEKFNIDLKNKLENKILFITFDMDYAEKCSVGDTYITINDIKNKLTCKSWKYHNKNYKFEYVISDENINDLKITFTKGKYEISNIKAYTLDSKYINNLNINELKVDLNRKNYNIINGNIEVENDGYFIIKIPYDNGFKIYIDNEEKQVLKLSNSFIGTKIEKGNHDIKIIYNAPLLKLGKIISIITFLIIIISLYLNKRGKKYMNKIIELYKKYKEIINYLFIGGCTTIVSLLTYTLFLEVFKVHYQISNIISWIFAVTFAYITNKIFVFNSKNKNLLKEIYLFVKYRIFSLLVDILLMYLLIDILKINELISKLFVQIIIVILNYVFSKLFVFKK